jgi:PAS domain S-box-containing protein
MSSSRQPSPACEGSNELQWLVDALPGMVYTCHPQAEWPLKWASSGCFALTGYSTEEMLGGDGSLINRITHPDDRAKVFAAIEQALEGRAPYVLEYRLRTKSGEVKWVWEKGGPRYDEQGALVSLGGFITDITPLKLSELSLRDAEQRLHSIFDNTAEGIFQTSADGTYLNVNPALARLYGYESPVEMIAELRDIRFQLYMDPNRRSQFIRLLERRDRVLNFESQVRRRDGTCIWISENARAVRDARRKLLYYEGTVEDITERKAAQDELANERNMLRTVIDAWPDVIYVKDTEGRYVLSNRAHTRNLGMTEPREIVGRKPEDFFVASRAVRLSGEDREIMQTGRAILNREEVRIGENNDQRWFLTAKLPLYDASGRVTGLVAMSRDITEHKQTAEQLRQSQKMEAIGRLAGGVAHDFNNIMTAILGYSEMIARNAGENTVLKHDIEQIHAGGLRAAALTQQLLTFSRKQVTLPKALNVNQVIRQMEQMLQRLIGENIRLETRLNEGVDRVQADVHQLEQVIMNLVINARDAIGDSGLIMVETSQVHLDALSAQQKFDVVPGSYIRIAISDDGAGVPKEIQERIFEPFFTTKEQGKGTGLGLATSYGIIQQCGGHICLQSEIGKGSTFSIFLPSVGSENEEPAAVNPVREMPGGSENILVTEDDQAVRELTRSLLEELGYHVREASNGEEALDLLQDENEPAVDLLLTDVVMPRLGGRQLAERVRTLSPNTRILFTSGYNEEEVLQRGIVAEEIAFIAKPFSTEALAHKIRHLLDDSSFLGLSRVK